jgi:hypothetical protein
MKNILSILLLVTSASLPAITFAGGDVCSGNICIFTSLSDSTKHAQFYCDVTGKVSEVRLVNHNVLISGFKVPNPDAGILTLKGSQVNDLQAHYFDVINDPKHNSVVKTMVVELPTNHSVVCHIGKGGRQKVYPGAYGR